MRCFQSPMAVDNCTTSKPPLIQLLFHSLLWTGTNKLYYTTLFYTIGRLQPIVSSILKEDQTSKGRSIQLALCQPPPCNQRTKTNGGPHSSNVFWGSTSLRGNMIVWYWRSASSMKDTRVETANEGVCIIIPSQQNKWSNRLHHWSVKPNTKSVSVLG
jgi:hypothetical protein